MYYLPIFYKLSVIIFAHFPFYWGYFVVVNIINLQFFYLLDYHNSKGKYFPHSVFYLLILSQVSILLRNLNFAAIKHTLSICLYGFISTFPISKSKILSAFSSISFILSYLMYVSLIYLECNYVWYFREESRFNFLHTACHLFHIIMKATILFSLFSILIYIRLLNFHGFCLAHYNSKSNYFSCSNSIFVM